MKARYRYRVYPSPGQPAKLARLFACCRLVWNDALALCKQAEKLPKVSELQKHCVTEAQQRLERVWLAEVSNIPSTVGGGSGSSVIPAPTANAAASQ